MSRFVRTLACLPLAATLLLVGGPARGAPAGGDADVTTQQQGPPGITAEAHYQSSLPGPTVATEPSSVGVVTSSVAATPVGADPEIPEVSSVVTGLPVYTPSSSSGGSGLAEPHPCVQVKVGPIETTACNPTPPGGAGQGGGGGQSGPGGGNGPPPPAPEELAAVAVDRAIAAAPRLRLRLAPSNVGLTGLESYFWLADRPRLISAVARVPGLTVVAEARPRQYVWQFGDGSEMVTVDPGTPWRPGRPGSIGHLYEVRGRYGVVVEAIWEARWRLGGGPWQSLGFFTTTGRRNYPVRQVVSRLVPGL